MMGITKRFGQTTANDDLHLVVQDAHIHAILGENGAGKTTLMRILFGEEQPDEGIIRLFGRDVTLSSPAEAIRQGIGLIHQNFMLIDEFTIPENFALGMEPTYKHIFCNYKPVREGANAVLESLDLPLDLNLPVGRFSVEEQQIIEVAKALYRGARVLILDEPTSVLTPQKVEKLLQTLLRLKEEGKTIILITHKLEEALAVADEITILRKGKRIATLPRAEADRDLLVSMMVGTKTVFAISRESGQPGAPLLSVRAISASRAGRRVVKNISLEVRRGEIFGLTGVGGNGQSELVEALVGLRQIDEGEILLGDQRIDDWDVRRRRKGGLAYVPEDRMHQGLAIPLSVLDNLIMGHHTSAKMRQGLRLRYGRAHGQARNLIEKYGIISDSEDAPARSLSGGNLQKLIIAREFAFNADLLIVAYPSQGIDIRTTSFVHKELLRLRDEGHAILLVTGDLDEVLAMSDRIGVMFSGELVAVVSAENVSRMKLGQYMTGVLRDI
jgi:simple sugar transport system ATP-binding protein